MTAPAPRPTPDLPDSIEDVHIIGICGTAMAALAGMLQERGIRVRGSDAMAYPPVSDLLADLGIPIHLGYDAAHLDPAPDLVVVGNVCRRENPEAVAMRDRGIPYMSLPEVLRAVFMTGRIGIVPTGTHGKTTTCSLIAWLLEEAELDPSYLIGGVPVNFGSNYRLGKEPVFLVEGDEYDTAYFDKVPKFWHYPPRFGTINNIEMDHADIYDSIEEIEWVFGEFAARVDPSGALWVNGEDARAVQAGSHAVARVGTFGLSDACDAYPVNLSFAPTGTHFELMVRGERFGPFHLPLWGDHNLRNAIGAILVCIDMGVHPVTIAKALPRFRGVLKRQEIKGEAKGVLVIDDFAHHPTALRETLKAIRRHHVDRRIWAVFEAKSNTSRRAVFQDEYSRAFVDADRVILSQPWKKDNLPEDQRISIPKLVADIRHAGTAVELIPTVDEIVRVLTKSAQPGDVVVGLSGSDFGGFHRKLLDALAE